jgi:gamma-glutamyltranspeptidase/glutathione hydrolase
MCPVVAFRKGHVAAVFGASGGRRIITGLAQVTKALADGSSMQEAVEEPRIYAESDIVLLDVRWPRDAAADVAEAGFSVELVEEQPTTVHFARPNGTLIDSDGLRRSGVDSKKPAGIATTHGVDR